MKRYVIRDNVVIRDDVSHDASPARLANGTSLYLATDYDALLAERDAARAELAELKIQCAAKDSVIATYESDKFGLSRSPDGSQLGVWKKGFPDE